MPSSGFRFAIDRGGTFTDVFARCPDGEIIVTKLLSEDPTNYKDAPREAIRRIMEQKLGKTIRMDQPLATNELQWVRMGTTVATNALLERKGERMVLLVTAGFKDLLHIGNQTRPKIFDLSIVCPGVLYEDIIEVDERIILVQEQCELNDGRPVVAGNTGDHIKVWKKLDENKLRADLQKVLDRGIESLAVSFLHSYIYPKHEERVGEIAKGIGFKHISLSSKVMPMVKIVPRAFTACADAYLTPHVRKYVESFASGFKDNLKGVCVLFMQSDGGVTPMEKFIGCRAILSGPAGGVVGYALTTYQKETNLPVIGFDMGGTSTDVSRYAGHYEHVFESITAGITIQAPQLDINTVAAGGGSRLFFRSGRFIVGPESAGAHPGPVCYRKGGPLTVTDANLYLGRILVEYFPKIFGPNENQPLDLDATTCRFKEMTAEINSYLEKENGDASNRLSVEQVAMGFIKVANEAMCQPIRALTQGRGFDTSRHVLACFGGAGGQHACSIARSLGMSTVFIHRYAGILSAYGMALADVVHEAQIPSSFIYSKDNFDVIDATIDDLRAKCVKALLQQGFSNETIVSEPFLHLRYDKTDCAVMCSGFSFTAVLGETSKHGNFQKAFIERYSKEFGFLLKERNIIVDDIRVRSIGLSNAEVHEEISVAEDTVPPVEMVKKCFFDQEYEDTNIYFLHNLLAGHVIVGPAIIIDKTSTILVEPLCQATITKSGDIKVEVNRAHCSKIGTELDAIQLSIFSHRFMSIAEQMGRILQRTSISTNIKERLDFSCALFGPDGGLVSNAPHIPIHLGAMQDAVQYQMRVLGDDIHRGDVLLSNHPYAGGSHLPDLTVITPVFFPGVERPVFFVAARAHHADIGGITPGSMPPHSTSLQQEGASFKSFKLILGGVFQEEALKEALLAPGRFPGSSGTRNLKDNVSDLQAQAAANQRGIKLVLELIDECGLDVVQAYMMHIQNNAEISVRDMLKSIAKAVESNTGSTTLHAHDYLDDGSLINLNIDIDKTDGSATFDFSGTGYETLGNCNTPRAVTMSTIIYCLRCMVKHDSPLNQGCLNPITVKIPEKSLLCPSENAAIVGGNVLTSQRLVDVILKAFNVCAASQGCTNNITFGDENSGYYETVCGGAGAGPGWHGRSGVHTHITNTRMTDAEILEKRYPVILQRFHLNQGTGGKGQYNGGDGVIREMLFRKNLALSVLTERRAFCPYGLNGGDDGKRGLNLIYYSDGRIVNLGSKSCVNVSAGDIFHLETPGGGGYGSLSVDQHKQYQPSQDDQKHIERGSIYNYLRAQESA